MIMKMDLNMEMKMDMVHGTDRLRLGNENGYEHGSGHGNENGHEHGSGHGNENSHRQSLEYR
jgi:hypothetical protein